MAEPVTEQKKVDRKGSKRNQGERLLTLSEISRRTGISMPTLQKYKKNFADRIPSKGKGRSQRYPEEAVPVFQELRKESSARRGRPRGAAPSGAGPKRAKTVRASKSGKPARRAVAAKRSGKAQEAAAKAPERSARRKPAAIGRKRRSAAGTPAAAGVGEQMLSLTEISKRTGISYPTLMRYVKSHLDRIPHSGEGRRRRFPPEAVGVFRDLYKGSRRGGRKAAASAGGRGKRAASAAGGGEVTSLLKRLERRLAALEKEIKKPIRLEVRR